MKINITLLAMTLLTAVTGCAVTPAQLREDGSRSTFTSTQTPIEAARCITRNAENGNLQARLMPLASGGQELLIFTTVDGAMSAMAIAELVSNLSGSDGTLIISGRVFTPDVLRANILKGC